MSKKSNYNIPHALKSYLEEEELSLYEEYYNTEACKKLREKLAEVLTRKIEDSYLKSEREARYTEAHWPLHQADAVGVRRTTRELIKLLTNK